MSKRMTDIQTTIVEQFSLGADETLDEFRERMNNAVEEHFAPKASWYVEAIGDGWLVVAFIHEIDGDISVDRVRTTWSQTGTTISLGESEKVKRRMVFVPEPISEGAKPVVEKIGLTDVLTEADVGKRFEFGETRDTILLEGVKVFEPTGMVQEAAPFEITEADFTSPSGEKYIAVMVGHGAAHSVINVNERLYDLEGEEGQPGMRKNVADQQAMIEAAFRGKRASMGSQLDHPNPDDGPGFRGLATELIDAKIDGTRVAIKEGVLATTEGQNLKIAAAHGFPIGKSTLAAGIGEVRVMDKKNPLFEMNTERDGLVYRHIFGFEIKQYDTVRHPSAGVFAQLKHAEMAREVREAVDALMCEDGTCPLDGKCKDGSTPKREAAKAPAITNPEPPNNPQETEMNENQVKQLIAEAVKETTQANAELKAAVDQLVEKQTSTDTALTETQGKLAETQTALAEAKVANDKLVDDLRDAKAVADVAREAIGHVTAERDAIALDKQIDEAVKVHVALKAEGEHAEIEPIRAKRAGYIRDMADRFDAPAPKNEDGTRRAPTADEMAEAVKSFVEGASARFDKVVGPNLAELHEAANRRKVAPADSAVRYAPGNGFSGDALPVSFTEAKETPKA